MCLDAETRAHRGHTISASSIDRSPQAATLTPWHKPIRSSSALDGSVMCAGTTRAQTAGSLGPVTPMAEESRTTMQHPDEARAVTLTRRCSQRSVLISSAFVAAVWVLS